MSWTLLITLILIGLIFVLLEVLVIPGGIAGIVGGGLVVVGIVLAYDTFGAIAGHITLAGTLVVSIILVIVAIRSNTWKKFTLSKKIDGRVNEMDQSLKVGDKGKTISRLAPMGKVDINDNFHEVYTHGEFIDQNVDIEIIKLQDNKIFVKQIINK
jgi:membrane-bound ClpP family serine protease